MSEDSMLMCLIAFVLGYLITRMMRRNGLSVGGQYPRPYPGNSRPSILRQQDPFKYTNIGSGYCKGINTSGTNVPLSSYYISELYDPKYASKGPPTDNLCKEKCNANPECVGFNWGEFNHSVLQQSPRYKYMCYLYGKDSRNIKDHDLPQLAFSEEGGLRKGIKIGRGPADAFPSDFTTVYSEPATDGFYTSCNIKNCDDPQKEGKVYCNKPSDTRCPLDSMYVSGSNYCSVMNGVCRGPKGKNDFIKSKLRRDVASRSECQDYCNISNACIGYTYGDKLKYCEVYGSNLDSDYSKGWDSGANPNKTTTTIGSVEVDKNYADKYVCVAKLPSTDPSV
jgi:hypothetical protein